MQRHSGHQNQTAVRLRIERCGKACRQQQILLDRPAHRQDAADLIDRRADDREVATVFAAHITLKYVVDIEHGENKAVAALHAAFGAATRRVQLGTDDLLGPVYVLISASLRRLTRPC